VWGCDEGECVIGWLARICYQHSEGTGSRIDLKDGGRKDHPCGCKGGVAQTMAEVPERLYITALSLRE